MPKKPKLTWANHLHKWKTCERCSLCETRSRAVVARGKIPCDILVIGEAPGAIEDTLGKPFMGPAGQLMDELLKHAVEDAGSPEVSFLMTNLVGCQPLDEDKRYRLPLKEEIQACAPRLTELLTLSKPEALIMVGRSSQKWCPELLDYDFVDSIDVMSPGTILRLDPSQKSLAIQRTQVLIRDLIERLM